MKRVRKKKRDKKKEMREEMRHGTLEEGDGLYWGQLDRVLWWLEN